MNVDLEELAAIIELLDKTEFTDFRFEKGDLKIAVRRGGLIEDAPASAQMSQVPAPASAPVAMPVPAAPTAAPAPLATPASTAPSAGHVIVQSPMLGTFYRGAKPGEAAFAQIGSTVDANDTLCIVEVMKLMSSVPAGVSGVVTAVYAKDGDLVEFGQPLFEIKLAA